MRANEEASDFKEMRANEEASDFKKMRANEEASLLMRSRPRASEGSSKSSCILDASLRRGGY